MRRTTRGLLVRSFILLVLLLVLIGLNVAGLAPLPGGPLSEEGFFENPLATSTLHASVVRGGEENGVYGDVTLYSSDLILANGLPFVAHLDRLVPLGVSGAIRAESAITRANPPAYPARFGPEIPSTFREKKRVQALHATEVEPFFSPEQPNWVHVLITVSAREGLGRIEGFALYYWVGPFQFRTNWRHELLTCIPPVGAVEYDQPDCIANGVER